MKKILSLLLVFSTATFTSLDAQLVWKSGYVILTSGDSVKGDIHVNPKKELDLFSKVTLKSLITTKTYHANQVKEYGFENEHFVARKVDDDMQFLKAISSGRVNLYELQYEEQRGSDIVVESDYYMEKNDGTSTEPQKVKANKFKKTVEEMMSDNSDLVTRVQGDDKKYEIADMESVVDEYNSWYVKQNGTYQGSR